MALRDTLESVRKDDYGEKEEKTSRVVNLTDDEAKELASYQDQVGPGEEMVIEATGKLEGDHFHILSVKYASGGGKKEDMNADAEAVMAKMRGPVTPMQVQPSPS